MDGFDDSPERCGNSEGASAARRIGGTTFRGLEVMNACIQAFMHSFPDERH